MEDTDLRFDHIPVLLYETVESLHIKPDGIYADGTLGGGGHAYEICGRLSKKGRYIGIDQDADAVAAASIRLSPFQGTVKIVRENYVRMKEVLNREGITKADGILLDLGVSSYQLDTKERGFSYKADAPLDMRMDDRQTKTAGDIINTYSEMELYHMILAYGEDRFAKNIAKHIVRERSKEPILTTFQLNEAIKAAIPAKLRAGGGHPSKKTFQAVRIELNQELQVLRQALEDMTDLLQEGGRLCIITFHSLEDRIVKQFFNKMENPCICPPRFPICTCGRRPAGKHVTKRPVLPSVEEMERNKRSKSAKLRVFEKYAGLQEGGR